MRLIGSLLALAMASCATVSHGTHETIDFDSSPSGAAVSLRCAEVTRIGTTPVKLEIRRNATDCVATISKDGFKTESVSVERSPAPAYWLNFIGVAALPIGISDNSGASISANAGLALVTAGTLGLAIDAFDGAMFRHAPSRVRITLARE